jgi:hypothetical protein
VENPTRLNGLYSLTEGEAFCATLSGEGWRVPTLDELLKTVHVNNVYPNTISLAAFPDTPRGQFWTSTEGEGALGANNFWTVDLFDGSAVKGGSATNFFYVRCVPPDR